MTRPIVAASTAVIPPMIATVFRAISDASNTGKNRATRNTPAATIVAAWIRELTGVGPSIASGSHVCSGNWPDFPTAPAKRPRAIHMATPGAMMSIFIAACISGMSSGSRPAAVNVPPLENK